MRLDVSVSVWFYHDIKIKTNRKEERKEVMKLDIGAKKTKFKKDFLGPSPAILVTLKMPGGGGGGDGCLDRGVNVCLQSTKPPTNTLS